MLSGFVSNLMFFIPRGGGVGFGDSFFTFFLFFLSGIKSYVYTLVLLL